MRYNGHMARRIAKWVCDECGTECASAESADECARGDRQEADQEAWKARIEPMFEAARLAGPIPQIWAAVDAFEAAIMPHLPEWVVGHLRHERAKIAPLRTLSVRRG